jgi:hypothetical protein
VKLEKLGIGAGCDSRDAIDMDNVIVGGLVERSIIFQFWENIVGSCYVK